MLFIVAGLYSNVSETLFMLIGKTVFITGGSRGIGEAIALRLAQAGANIVIAAKSDTPHPKLPGTIYSVIEEVEKLGAKGLAVKCDIREEENIHAAVAQAVEHFGGIDILINNASAINLSDTANTPLKRYDLMMDVNTRGTFACTQACLPYLAKAENPHVLTLSPPINLNAKWFAGHVAYTISKYGMSMCTLGFAEEFKSQGIAVNSLWPRSTIATAAIEFNFSKNLLQASRKPSIMADAAFHILSRNSREVSGNFFIDEEVLKQAGVTDFTDYAVNPEVPLYIDLFLDA
jgi:citronellol/citronellal dehydrogenase